MQRVLCIFVLMIWLGFDQPRPDTFIIPIKNTNPNQVILPDTMKNALILPDEFWLEFTRRFPGAAVCFFHPEWQGETLPYLKIGDTSYTYISLADNRLWLVTHLPKDLSERESHNYSRNDGFFVLQKKGADTTIVTESKWVKASVTFNRQYDLLYQRIKTVDSNYVFIVNKKYRQSMMDLH